MLNYKLFIGFFAKKIEINSGLGLVLLALSIVQLKVSLQVNMTILFTFNKCWVI